MNKVFEKHPLEKRGSIILFGVYTYYYTSINRTPKTVIWGIIIFAILGLAILYARYEKITITPTYIEHRKLHLIIPQTKTVMFKHINDVNVTTRFPTLSIIRVMTANNDHLKFQYFERAAELKHLILEKAH